MQYEFIPRILSGAAELEIDFYRDLYELGSAKRSTARPPRAGSSST